jgi:hypothetical protein
MVRAALIPLMIVLTGCATHRNTSLVVPNAKLQRDKSVAIAVPPNGSYGGRSYVGSGRMTADALRAAFARHTYRAVILDGCQDLNCLLAQSGQDYLVLPEIFHWEDRNTEWSGRRDRLEVKITVFSGATHAPIASTVVTAKSSWATFGGDHPQDMLPKPISEFINSLY